MTAAGRTPTRTVVQADARIWLRENRVPDCSVITSLPDVSEVPTLGFAGWRTFFMDAAAQVMAAVPDHGVAVFFQSDIKHDGRWIDKGYLVMRALEDSGAALLWHHVVCRKPPGTAAFGRATYAHLLGFSRGIRPDPARPTVHVLPDGGALNGRKAMGMTACLEVCRFIARQTATRTVLDPFCGNGTTLAAANAIGIDAVGIDISARMCRRARTLAAPDPG